MVFVRPTVYAAFGRGKSFLETLETAARRAVGHSEGGYGDEH